MNKYQEAINYVVDRYLDIDYQEKPMNDDTKYNIKSAVIDDVLDNCEIVPN